MMTVTRMATATRLILVTVDPFYTPKKKQSPKTMTVTRMATATRLIPVTFDTFDTPTMHGSKNDDSYEDRDRGRPDPCDC